MARRGANGSSSDLRIRAHLSASTGDSPPSSVEESAAKDIQQANGTVQACPVDDIAIVYLLTSASPHEQDYFSSGSFHQAPNLVITLSGTNRQKLDLADGFGQ
jgi:hypothetical protein